MTKDECLNILQTLLGNFLFGSAAEYVLSTNGLKYLNQDVLVYKTSTGSAEIQLDELRTRLNHPEQLEHMRSEFGKSLMRSLFGEGHEAVLAYCEETDQFAKYKAQSWFQYARIVRNIVSHKVGGVLERWPPELTKKGITEVHWRTETLKSSMVGQRLKIHPAEAIRLFEDQRLFVRNDLS